MAADYDLSGQYIPSIEEQEDAAKKKQSVLRGGLRLPALELRSTYYIPQKYLDLREVAPYPGDALATYHSPRRGDLNTGYSFVVMLDGHTRKVTISDQLRKSRQVSSIEPSELGPGGNVSLAWPLDIAPPLGWENQ